MTDRQGIEVDYCPKCRGVWLDRGELDKLVERSAAQSTGQRFAGERGGDRDSGRYETEHRHDDDYHEGQHPKKKRGFLRDFFDFD
jgi:Zn-finger nucleic acid-binding protein